ncbi:MAG TPA: protein translocase subunit SecD [Pirellulales bacterium]|nr:protein translocase subunit SecD [Pirellulales bacterium]
MLAPHEVRRASLLAAAIGLALFAMVAARLAPVAVWAQEGLPAATQNTEEGGDENADEGAPDKGKTINDEAPGPAGTNDDQGDTPPTGPAPGTLPGPNAPLAPQGGAQKPADTSGHVFMMVALVAAVFIVPVLVGNYLSKALRMPDHAMRMSVVLFAISASGVATVTGWPPKLGIDLRGGAILVYEVKDKNFKDMDKLVGAVTKRVNPDGLKEVTVRPYGEHEIEIIIPEADEAELARMQDIVSQQGTLEFRIVADSQFSDDEDYINLANEGQFEGEQEVTERDKNGKTVVRARWVPVVPYEVGAIAQRGHAIRENKKGETEVLALMDSQNVTGEYLTSATAGNDENARPCVHFRFNQKGAKLFGRLTSNNLPDPIDEKRAHKLAIILDGKLHSAPFIRSRIDDQGQITGSFTTQEVERLADVLTAGSLPTTLREEPTSSMHTGPTLGEDTIAKGVKSMLVSSVAVVIFMLLYYRFAGFVANLALALNVLLIVAFMILFNAAFTLAGLAGLALTVGMAVDANVLIYERMREELNRGATLRMAIRNGFDRASVTIIDSNVTNLISAIVLWFIGTDQVKGFAVTLLLGIAMNLFTAITFTRLIFDAAEKHRWIKQLKMLKILENPDFDFIGKRRLAITFSLLLIGTGLVGVYLRGRGL